MIDRSFYGKRTICVNGLMPRRMRRGDDKAWYGWARCAGFSVLLGLSGLGGLIGCGTIGPPVAPQDIGVNMKREKDRIAKEKMEKDILQSEDQSKRGSPSHDIPGGPISGEQILEEEAPINPGIRPDSGVLVRPR